MNIITILVWLTFTFILSGVIVGEFMNLKKSKLPFDKGVRLVFIAGFMFGIVIMTYSVFTDATTFESQWWLLFVVVGTYFGIRLYFELIMSSKLGNHIDRKVDATIDYFDERLAEREERKERKAEKQG